MREHKAYGRRQRFVYELIDPRSGNVFYIGQTYCPKERLQQHINAARKAASDVEYPYNLLRKHKSPNEKMISQILACGHKPVMNIIKTGDWTIEEAEQEERIAICSAVQNGVNLKNAKFHTHKRRRQYGFERIEKMPFEFALKEDFEIFWQWIAHRKLIAHHEILVGEWVKLHQQRRQYGQG